MDYMVDETDREEANRVLVNHEPLLRHQTPENARSVSTSALPIAKSHVFYPALPLDQSRDHSTKLALRDDSENGHDSSTNANSLARSQTLPAIHTVGSTISMRRGFNFSLPPFNGLPRSPTAETGEMSGLDLEANKSAGSGSSDALTRISSFPITLRSPSVGPLTPPIDTDLTSWLSQAPTNSAAPGIVNHSNPVDPAQPSANPLIGNNQPQLTPNVPSIELSTLNFAGTPWFQKVLEVACAAIDADTSTQSVKIISQVLPMNASDQRSTKTYEMVCDRIQQFSAEPRDLTITHARKISPGQVVEDFPKSPPATPFRSGGDSYFGHQTIFTHVAEVPVHHETRAASNTLEMPAQRHIMTAEASSIILERYIPPTTREETLDLFAANSCRSYLADRLPELAPITGSMIFIYPTKTGAQTFAKRYVGPVLDPLLREMSILKGLNTNAAERLGRMKSIESMFDFPEMQSRLRKLCESLNSRAAFVRTRTDFRIEHSDCVNIVLDRDTWMTWFVEQEQQRMKEDLVDFHRDGGKLPDSKTSNTEITAGMLSREVADGLRKSTKQAGDVGVEVGVFVIRRHKKPLVV